MSLPLPQSRIETVVLACIDLPPLNRRAGVHVASQIANSLRYLILKNQVMSSAKFLLIPSVLDLSSHFRVSESDIFEALFTLSQEEYTYELHGLDLPIKLSLAKRSGRRRKPNYF